MDFVKSYFGKNEPLTSSEVHFYRSTSYKIHTLVERSLVVIPKIILSQNSISNQRQTKSNLHVYILQT